MPIGATIATSKRCFRFWFDNPFTYATTTAVIRWLVLPRWRPLTSCWAKPPGRAEQKGSGFRLNAREYPNPVHDARGYVDGHWCRR